MMKAVGVPFGRLVNHLIDLGWRHEAACLDTEGCLPGTSYSGQRGASPPGGTSAASFPCPSGAGKCAAGIPCSKKPCRVRKSLRCAGQIRAVSGWRSRAEQRQIWNDSLRENGEAFTRSYVALPGCSEHETGLAIDLAAEAPEIDFIRPDFPRDGVFAVFRRLAPLFRLDRAIHGGERRDHRHRSGTLAFSLCGNTTRFHPLESGNLSRGISCLFQAGKRHPFSVRRRDLSDFSDCLQAEWRYAAARPSL